MAANSELVELGLKPRHRGSSSQDLVRETESRELFFAVVGHVGSGTSTVAKELQKTLVGPKLEPEFDVHILKARGILETWDAENPEPRLSGSEPGTLAYVRELQDIGDRMRAEQGDHAAIARELVRKIRITRESRTQTEATESGAVFPDGQRRAYILDSVRHPAEVELLASIYKEAFVLIGVVCEEDVRSARLHNDKFRDAGINDVRRFMLRDAKSQEKHGQRVSDAFHLAHFFVDNTESREDSNKKPNPHWTVVEQLSRLKKILTRDEVVRPSSAETAMFAARGSQLRSSCLSRQVGASIVDGNGNVVAIGTNEVPRAGGGVYGTTHDLEPDGVESRDERCFLGNKYCSNNKEQNRIGTEVLDIMRSAGVLDSEASDEDVISTLLSSPIGGLLEFSRAVHAEMDAVLSLTRRGLSSVGTKVFVTTFPCHYCARHLVASGVEEVQYIEPYPKSRALALHSDAIATRKAEWKPREDRNYKVLFRPFVGVAPRLYSRAFTKDRALKDRAGKHQIGDTEWISPTHLGIISYPELEARLAGGTE